MDERDGTSPSGDDTAENGAEFRVMDVAEQRTAVVRGRVPMAELRGFFDRAFRELGLSMAEGQFEPAGPALALYRGVPVEVAELEVGFPVLGQVSASGSVVEGRIPDSRAVTTVHRGNYDDLGASWGGLAEWAREQGLTLDDLLWEVYVTEPRVGGDPDDMVTELYWALRR